MKAPGVSVLSKGRIDNCLPSGEPAKSFLSAKREGSWKCFFRETVSILPHMEVFKEASFTPGKLIGSESLQTCLKSTYFSLVVL